MRLGPTRLKVSPRGLAMSEYPGLLGSQPTSAPSLEERMRRLRTHRRSEALRRIAWLLGAGIIFAVCAASLLGALAARGG